MSRSLSWTLLLSAAGLAATACGARTGNDELLGDGGLIGVGGHAQMVGGSSTGGTGGVSTGGWVNTGGAVAGGTGGVSTGGVIGTGGVIDPGPCCFTSDGAGCQDPFVNECVCGNDPFCCEQSWDQLCVEEIGTFGCGTCNAGGTGGIGGTGGVIGIGGSTGGAISTGGTGGVIFTGGTGGIISTGGTGGVIFTGGTGGVIVTGGTGGVIVTGGTGGVIGTGGTGGNPGSCCSTHSAPGCSNDPVEQCVCKGDPYCCQYHWDNQCMNEVEDFGCGKCSTGTGGSGTGGTGGSGQCEAVFGGDSCGQCLCNQCYSELYACLTDFGCLAILQCFNQTNCVGVNCYKPQTCKGVVDTFGGWNGPSMGNALEFAACSGLSSCPCQ